MKINRIVILISILCLVTTGCSYLRKLSNATFTPVSTQNSPSADSGVGTIPATAVKPTSNMQDVTLDKENDNILGRYGNTLYFWRMEKDNCVLYSIDDNESLARQLAIFPPMDSDTPSTNSSIINFGVCGDWLIASVGHYEGSGHYFFGDFVRLKKDGSELAHFYLTDDDKFIIVGEWIYYNFWTIEDLQENDTYGCYRIHPDGTGKEYLGNIISSIILYADDGYIYGERDTGEEITYRDTNFTNAVYDLIRCKPDGSGSVTLFSARTLPKFSDADSIGYFDVVVKDDFITFTVFVHGQSEGDSWHGHYLYKANYHVNKDGSKLTLLVSTVNSSLSAIKESFTGTWQRTNVESSMPSKIIINNVTTEGFDFSVEAFYWSHTGLFNGKAKFIRENEAVCVSIDNEENVEFHFVLNDKKITIPKIEQEGLLPVGAAVTIDRDYIKGSPHYTNAGNYALIVPNDKTENIIKSIMDDNTYSYFDIAAHDGYISKSKIEGYNLYSIETATIGGWKVHIIIVNDNVVYIWCGFKEMTFYSNDKDYSNNSIYKAAKQIVFQ